MRSRQRRRELELDRQFVYDLTQDSWSRGQALPPGDESTGEFRDKFGKSISLDYVQTFRGW